MSGLTQRDFGDWFHSVHGQAPLPWQQRLLERVLCSGWPKTIALPTASGKTAVLDIAIFALACEVNSGLPRKSPLRVAFVVDRRIVVDGAFERAQRIERAITGASDEITRRVATALRTFGGEVPLRVSALRGGLYREDRWARSPREPAVLCSTVDQVGSRLLHRGYGLSPNMWPIHAGLLGEDTLFILDEAHCSVPFAETLRAVEKLRVRAEHPLGLPWAFTSMTATPHEGMECFELDDADRAHPVLQVRAAAKKPIYLKEAPAAEAALAKTFVEEAVARALPGEFVLVVVNRVKLARRILQLLLERQAKGKAKDALEVILLTGRVRAVERDALLARYWSRLCAGRDRLAHLQDKPLVVVATQCVEVGADLDADALITQLAPFDALRQRLGRLDRLGQRGNSPCVVVIPNDSMWDGEGAPPLDAIYGAAPAHTYRLLRGVSELDGGIDGLTEVVTEATESCLSPVIHAPTFFPIYADLLTQTAPPPHASPDPAIFLHGPRSGEPEVQIVFRADLPEACPERWLDIVAACSPVTAEALSLRLDVARGWLAEDLSDENLSDLEGQGEPDARGPDEKADQRPFLIWRGPDDSELSVSPRALAPGYTIVVPSSYGGCDDFGWAPAELGKVRDVADPARSTMGRAPVLRLHHSLELTGGAAVAAASRTTFNIVDEEVSGKAEAALRELAIEPGTVGSIAVALLADGKREVVPHPSGVGLVVSGCGGWARDARDFTDADDSASRAVTSVTLEGHLALVGSLAASFCQAVGASAALQADLELAGANHDLGKADPRFQAWLHGGDRFASHRGPLLAKSRSLPTSPAAMRAARRHSQYPEGGRHELLSVRLLEGREGGPLVAHDIDLVLHLVGSHHGHCRPFAPVVVDDRSVDIDLTLGKVRYRANSETLLEALGSGVAERFHRLLRRYGWWGLAYLEACLRLADHRASEGNLIGKGNQID